MALYRCGGGGTPISTTLWTNSSPTSSTTGIVANLSQGLSNFDYVAFKFRISTTNSTQQIGGMMSIADFIATAGSDYPGTRSFIGYASSSSLLYVRSIRYSSNTQVLIGNAFKVITSGTPGTTPTQVIPLEVIGIKIA